MLRHLRWAILWAGVIMWLCLIPGKSLPQWHWFDILDLDKSVHAGMFFVLALLLAQAFAGNGSPKRYLLWAVIISAAYGIGTEIMQGLEALGRRADPIDMLANTIGAIAATFYAQWRERKGKPIMPLSLPR